ncbi:DUF2207 domain-containing protein [bacterium]|nr:DUF2207 domain-containing protein [bacterium]
MKIFKYILIAVALLCTTPAMAWQITSYDTRMDIQKDSSIIVTETITADFTNDPHHGIYRDIPLTGEDRYRNKYRIRETTLGVTDNSGTPQTYKQTAKGGRINIRIGNAGVLVSGPKTYVIKYRLWRAVHFFSDYDEIYWNVVGPEWQVPINNATCIVTIPDGAKPGSIQTASYTGALGSTSSDGFSDTPDSRTARFWMRRAVNPGEYMTIVVGWPKGLVTQPSFSQEAKWFVADNGYFFLPVFFLCGLWLFWLKEGRDPDTGKSEMIAYDPPDGMSPAEIGTLIDERVDMRDISASIIDLAVRGIIRIESEKTKGFLSTKIEHTLRLTSSYSETRKNSELSSFDNLLIQALFNGLGFCIVSQLSGRFYSYLPMLRSKLYDSMVKRGYFNRRPDEVRIGYQMAGWMLAAVGFAGGIMLVISSQIPAAIDIPAGWAFATGLCGIMLAIGSRFMPRKTKKGKNALLAVKGFEEYISRAERADIEYQERQSYFEKFLPYAMAFGVVDKWARAFDGLQTEPPKWYHGYDGSFQPTIFAYDLDIATSDWNSIMSTRPRTCSSGDYANSGSSDFFSGDSGFSGGCSGGGGGGGGGGAW